MTEAQAVRFVEAQVAKVRYIGVYKNVYKNKTQKHRSAFKAQICVDGKMRGLGSFITPKEAAQAYDYAAIHAGHPTSKLNFFDQVPMNYMPKKKKLRSTNTIGYRGVYKNGTRFQARIRINGKLHNIGYFDTTKDAAIAFDLTATEAKRPISDLNFPDMIHTKMLKNKFLNKKKKKKRKTKKSSTSTKSNSSSSRSSSCSSSSSTGGGGGGHVLTEFPSTRTGGGLI